MGVNNCLIGKCVTAKATKSDEFRMFQLRDKEMAELILKNRILTHQNASLKLKQTQFLDLIRFYKSLSLDNDFDRGFYKAFEIMEQYLLQNNNRGGI